MPTSLIIEFFGSGVDLLGLGRSIPKSATPTPLESDLHSQLRCTAVQVIATLLLYRTDGLQSMKSFCLAGWSLLADRILYDPSRRVFKAALEAVSTLCAVLYRNSRHRMNDTGVPSSRSKIDAQNLASAEANDFYGSWSWKSNVESELAPLTPGTATATFAALGVFSTSAAESLSVVVKSQSSLEKYGHVVFVKILPHIYSFVNRCRWLDNCDLPPGLLLLSCLLEQLEPLSGEHSNIQVHFMTSPKHLIGEVVETFLFPLLYAKDEALVFEAASNLINISKTTDSTVNPGWVLAACRALTGLLSRETARSVIQRVVPVLIESLRLLSPGVLLPVLILTLQHVQKLQLPSTQRLPMFYSLISIPIQLCDSNALDPVSFFPSFFKHPWIASLIATSEEDHFREDLMGVLMKSLLEHWSAIAQANSDAEAMDSRFNARNHSRTDSDSESSASATGTASFSTRSKRLSSSFQQGLLSSIAASSGQASAGLGSSNDALSPRSSSPASSGSSPALVGVPNSLNTAQAAAQAALNANGGAGPLSPASQLKRFKQWREVVYLVVISLMKCLSWKTHVRTYCYTLYLNLVDGVGQALGRTKSARPQLRDMLTKVLENALSLKSDAVCLRYCYVIMKHVLETGTNKLVDALYKATQARFLSFLAVPLNTSSERSLGYRVDQLFKTSLSPADLEILVLLLHMFSKHSAISDPIPDDERGGTPLPNPKLAATLHYIESIKKFRVDDPVAAHRYAQLESIQTSHNLANLISTVSQKLSSTMAGGSSGQSGSAEGGKDSRSNTPTHVDRIAVATATHNSGSSSGLSARGGPKRKNSKSHSLSVTTATPNTIVMDLPLPSPTSIPDLSAFSSHSPKDLSESSSGAPSRRSLISPRLSASTSAGGGGSGSGNGPASARIRLPSALDGAMAYVPPIEYLSKDVAEKHPDDEFMIMYSKSCLPTNEELDAMRQLDRPMTLTSPSDPFVVEAYHFINVEYQRISFYLRVTNLTNFIVPKVILNVDTKGRLEPFNAQVMTHTAFTKMCPGETSLWHTSFKLNSVHINELMVRLRLQSAASASTATGSSQPTLDIQCMPYRINMHVTTLPWIIAYSDYTREWGRYTNAVSFNVLLDHSVSLQQLDSNITSSYHRQIAWTYNDTFQMAYSGITWWDERVLIIIFAAKKSEDLATITSSSHSSHGLHNLGHFHHDLPGMASAASSPYTLRFELRTSSPNLCVVVDNNREHWLRDLMPLVPNWFTFPSDSDYANSLSDPLFGYTLMPESGLPSGVLLNSASSAASETSFVSGTGTGGRLLRHAESTHSSASLLDERLMLDQWNKARVS